MTTPRRTRTLPLARWRLGRAGCALATGLLALQASSAAAPPLTPPPAQRLECALPGGATLAIVHTQGRPLAVALSAVAGPRECASRSTAPPQPDAGGWRFDWVDATLNTRYAARVTARPGGGFQLRLSVDDDAAADAAVAAGVASAPDAARVPCGPLTLPAEAMLQPADARCLAREDRSEALQATWAALRGALLTRSPAALQGVLAARVMLAEGASGDSPRVEAGELARHLACVAALTHRGQRLDDWARGHPHLLTATTGVEWPDDATALLTGFGGLQWQGGRWQLTWLAASRAVLLRDCG